MMSCAATLADELFDFARQAIDLLLAKLLDRRLGELGALLDDQLAVDLDVADRALAVEGYSNSRDLAYLPPFSTKTVSGR